MQEVFKFRVSKKKCTEVSNSISITDCDNNQSLIPKAREQLYQLRRKENELFLQEKPKALRVVGP